MTEHTVDERTGRIVNGAFALMAGAAIVIWWSLAKRLIAALRRATADRRAPM